MTIQYKKMSVFSAPIGSVLVHACNCQGVWGRGVAQGFKECFPTAFNNYRSECLGNSVLGRALLLEDSSYIGCIMTSQDYGSKIDPPESILLQTEKSLHELCRRIEDSKLTEVYSPKFNSGLFRVPWEESEAVLDRVLKMYPTIKWTVCEI